MTNRIVLVMALSAAFILFAAFHSSGLEDIYIVSGIVSGVHFGHFAKLVYKIFKWGLKK